MNKIFSFFLILFVTEMSSQSSSSIHSIVPKKLLDSIQNSTWDANLNKFSRSQSFHYTYNKKGIVSNFKDAYLNRVTNRWLNRFKIDYFFKTGTDIVQYDIRTLWDTVSKTYVNDKRNDNTILNDKVTSTTSSLWNKTTTGWEQSNRSTYSYLGNGLTNVYTEQRFDKSSNQWINVFRNTFTYNSDKNIVKTLFELWDNASNSWRIQSHELTTYNGTKITEVVAQAWNNTTKVFTNVNKKENKYNSLQLIDEIITYFWSESKGKYEINSKIAYTYDSDNDRKTSLRYNYNTATSTYSEAVQEIYHYSIHEITKTIDPIQNSLAIIYPTLASDRIHFIETELREIKIFSMDGKCILKTIPETNNTIDISTLAPGTYHIITLSQLGVQRSEMFVKL
ncbi:MAG: T9SS type A sorting domain-containing protein [Saprospiraceae bacterium]|nr:T9SS type A sorting domain-containing protein [Saprospiraceae bacterium]